MADFNSKYSGEQVETLLDQVASGNAGGGGGGGITVETDPIFSASPAATITNEKMAEWDGKQDAISDLETIRSGASKGATSVQPDDIEDFVKSSELADVAYTADYNELENKPTFKTINGESVVGSGNITIAGGSGEVGPQGPQGDKGEKGDTGVGVQSVKQTTISNTDGGSNVVTVTLTNGTTSTFTVKNGSKGSNGTNGTNGKDGADGDDGATFTPSVDSAGNLSWTNNKGLTNPPTVNIKGPKGDAGEGGGSSGGKEVVLISNGVIELLERDKIYIVEDSTGSRTFEIQSIEEYFFGSGSYAEYVVIFASEDDMGSGKPLSIILPDNVYWANGQIPDLTLNANYELSIVGWEASNNSGFNAVITPFKPV